MAEMGLPQLTQRCAECDGCGYVDTDEGEKRCGVCDGRARVPTQAGEMVLDLVREFLGAGMTRDKP